MAVVRCSVLRQLPSVTGHEEIFGTSGFHYLDYGFKLHIEKMAGLRSIYMIFVIVDNTDVLLQG